MNTVREIAVTLPWETIGKIAVAIVLFHTANAIGSAISLAITLALFGGVVY